MALGNANCGLTESLATLQLSATYDWSVQAVDAAFAGGAFAPERSFTYAVTGIAGDGAPRSVKLVVTR